MAGLTSNQNGKRKPLSGRPKETRTFTPEEISSQISNGKGMWVQIYFEDASSLAKVQAMGYPNVCAMVGSLAGYCTNKRLIEFFWDRDKNEVQDEMTAKRILSVLDQFPGAEANYDSEKVLTLSIDRLVAYPTIVTHRSMRARD